MYVDIWRSGVDLRCLPGLFSLLAQANWATVVTQFVPSVLCLYFLSSGVAGELSYLLSFSMGVRNPTTRLYTYTAHTLPIEPHLQSPNFSTFILYTLLSFAIHFSFKKKSLFVVGKKNQLILGFVFQCGNV